MEICEKLYEVQKLTGDDHRLGRLGLVMVMAGTLASAAVYADPSRMVKNVEEAGTVLSGETGSGFASAGMTEGLADSLTVGNSAFAECLDNMKIPVISAVTDDMSASDISVEISKTPAVPVIPDVVDIADVEEPVIPIVPDASEEPAVSDAGDTVVSIIPDISETEEPAVPDAGDTVTPIVPDVSEESAAPIVPDNSAVPGAEDMPSHVEESESEISDTGMTSINGYSVNEAGMICGIADPETAVADGYMELPSEGCTGIAAGAFDGAPAGIREIYIPGNITLIEERALAGLTDMEWIEADPASGYVSVDGVLFSESGTCLLAFPAGRIGTYKVPENVTRFAFDAFRSSCLTAVDAGECTLADKGNLPERITLI